MSFLKVQTAQNVLLEYMVGNIGQRVAAATIDLIITLLYIWLMTYAFNVILGISLWQNNPYILYNILVILPAIFYQPLSEYFWNGKTVGKHFLRLKVVKEDGTTASLGDYLLRWVLRTVDVKIGFLFIFFLPRSPQSAAEEMFIAYIIVFMLIPLPIVGIVSMAISNTCQRVGDRVANTVVIKLKRPYSIEDTILKNLEEDYKPQYENVLMLSDRDIHIIKNVIDNAEHTGNYTSLMELSDKAKNILDVKDDSKPLPFLKTLIKDYNYLAKEKDLSE